MDSQSARKENVVSLAQYRTKKETESELSRGRKPLYVSHMDGKVTGSPHLKSPSAGDFGDRIQRIRHSLERINSLMSELKRISKGSSESSKDKI